MQLVDPLDTEKQGLDIVVTVGQVTLERAHGLAALAERRVEQGERLREAEVRRPLRGGLFEDRAGLREGAGAAERVAEPQVDLGELIATDERRLPGAGGFQVVSRRGEGG